jgi:hypothetical protein
MSENTIVAAPRRYVSHLPSPDRTGLIEAGCAVLTGAAGREAIVRVVDAMLARDRGARLDRDQGDRLWAAHRAAAKSCCELLAAQRGWTHARRRFTSPQLARNRRPGTYPGEIDGCLIDHPECFRWPHGWKRPAAILSHSYVENLDKHRAFGDQHGLAIEPLPFSWYYRGTIAVLYTRKPTTRSVQVV